MLTLPKQSIRCAVAVTPCDTDLDEKAYQLQRYLERLLPMLERPAWVAPVEQLWIDIGVLGTRDVMREDEDMPYWNDCLVYPIRFDRALVIFGPLRDPGQADTACPRCLERRWFSIRPQTMQTALIGQRQMMVSDARMHLSSFELDEIAAVLAWNFHLLASNPMQQGGAISVLNCNSMQVVQYHVPKDSTCPVCATPLPDSAQRASLHLRTRPKKDPTTYRLCKATDYALPMSALINPVAGMLGGGALSEWSNTLTAPVTGQFGSRSDATVYEVWWSGHGNSYQQSLYAGLLEGIERYSGIVPRGKRMQVVDSYEHLAPDALDPRTCGVYSDEFYQQHAATFQPFHPQRPMTWVWGYSFGRQQPLLVPEQLVYYMSHRNTSAKFVQDSSNGCATGSCIEEAVLYGLLELVERDAFLLTWYAQLAPGRIDPRSSKRRETLFTLERIERQGYDLYLFDTRLDVRIPSMIAVARRKQAGLGNIIVAAGSGMDPEDALQGALCEVASYVSNIEVRIEGRIEQLRAMVQDYRKVTTLTDHATLYALPEMGDRLDFLFQGQPVRGLEDAYRDWYAEQRPSDDLRDDLLFCIEHMQRLGMDVIVVDQTAPEQEGSGLKTACVIVPGLLPIDFGWGRDRVLDLPRLRTVPRSAGFRETDFVPDSAAVIPHPFP
jgi:ribosomal protein S12 methylthiotransferase accessory factor